MKCKKCGRTSDIVKLDEDCPFCDKTFDQKALEDFEKEILYPTNKDWGICPEQVLAIKDFIKSLLQSQREEIKKESIKLFEDFKKEAEIAREPVFLREVENQLEHLRSN